MAYIAGKLSDEMQVAECWEPGYISQLYRQLCLGAGEAGRPRPPYFSIGGITCISIDETAAVEKAKYTMAVYIPYLKGIMSKSGIDINKKNIKMIDLYSKTGQFHEAVPFISDELVHNLSLSGTPTQVKEKLETLLSSTTIRGILLSPPYGTLETIEDNLQFIMEQVISKIK